MLRYASLGAERPGPYAKSVPPLPGTVDEWLAGGPRLSDLATPVLTLDRAALRANAERMAGWCAAHGVDLAPHGKTTMAPALWDLQLRHGAWGSPSRRRGRRGSRSTPACDGSCWRTRSSTRRACGPSPPRVTRTRTWRC
nr:hypothetical protein [Pseudonocardia sp. AL041005-10]